MKTYEKPGLFLMQLVQEERISAGCESSLYYKWVDGTGANQDVIDFQYKQGQYADIMPAGYNCGVTIEASLLDS